MDERAVMLRRHELGIHPRYRMVDSCAAEFAAKTPYYYSTYETHTQFGIDLLPDIDTRTKERIVTIGSGPIRIGQGIEFDYGCVHAVKAFEKAEKMQFSSTTIRKPCPQISTPQTDSISTH